MTVSDGFGILPLPLPLPLLLPLPRTPHTEMAALEVAYMAAKGVGMKPADDEVKTRQPGFWLESSRPYR